MGCIWSSEVDEQKEIKKSSNKGYSIPPAIKTTPRYSVPAAPKGVKSERSTYKRRSSVGSSRVGHTGLLGTGAAATSFAAASTYYSGCDPSYTGACGGNGGGYGGGAGCGGGGGGGGGGGCGGAGGVGGGCGCGGGGGGC